MVYSAACRVGGDKFDEAIVNYIRRNYGMLIGETTAEQIKKTIGSAFPGSEVKEMEVKGRNLAEGIPRSFTVSSNEILEALTDPLNSIVSSVKSALERTPPELGRRHRRAWHGAHRRRALLRDVEPAADGRDGAARDRRGRSAHLRRARLRKALENMEKLQTILHQRLGVRASFHARRSPSRHRVRKLALTPFLTWCPQLA
jgi:hypothetical protein